VVRFNRIQRLHHSLKHTHVIEEKITWQDFATVKNWKKQLKKHSKKKELSHNTWKLVGHYFPKFLKLSGKTPDELIEESLVDPEAGEDRIDAYFDVLKQMISHNSARVICYGNIQGFYSHNRVNTRNWTTPEPEPSQVKDTDDNFPVWVYNEADDEFELNRKLFQDFFNRLNPTYRAVAFALIGTGQDIGIVLKRNVGFVRNQDYRHKRLSLNDNRSKTSEIIDGFYSVEATDAARSLVASERQNAEDNDPLYTTSIAHRKREFRKIHGYAFRSNGVDVLPPAKRLEGGTIETAFRKAQRAMGIKLVKGRQGPLRPKRLRKIYRTAADLAGLGDDKARQLIGQSNGNRSSGVYLETSREMQERTYMKVENKIWIFKESESLPNKKIKELESKLAVMETKHQKVEELERVQKITLARIDEMGEKLRDKQVKQMEEDKQLTDEQQQELANLVYLRMDIDPKFKESFEKLLNEMEYIPPPLKKKHQ